MSPGRGRAEIAALWVVFLLAHLWVALLGWWLPSQPMGDVVLVYEPWSSSALGGGAIVGITEPWVYPQLALVPMLLAKLLSWPLVGAMGVSGAYLVAWAVLVTVLDAIGFAVLVGLGRTGARRGRSGPRRTAGWFWCAALLLLGPIAMYRIDAVTVPIALIGGLWLSRRPVLAAALLTIGAWIKIWPGALALAAVIALKRRMRVLAAAVIVAAAVVAVLFLLGADRELFAFLTQQTGRGLQIEAVAATPFLWMALGGTAAIEYSHEILTFQIRADAAQTVSALLTPVMALVVLGLAAAGAIKAAHGASWHRLFPPLALALVTALIVTNKVGSPQFQVWLLVPVMLWIVLDRTRSVAPSLLAFGLMALTFLVYPLTYDALLRAEYAPILVLSLRNLLLVVLLIISSRALLRVPAAPRTDPARRAG